MHARRKQLVLPQQAGAPFIKQFALPHQIGSAKLFFIIKQVYILPHLDTTTYVCLTCCKLFQESLNLGRAAPCLDVKTPHNVVLFTPLLLWLNAVPEYILGREREEGRKGREGK